MPVITVLSKLISFMIAEHGKHMVGVWYPSSCGGWTICSGNGDTVVVVVVGPVVVVSVVPQQLWWLEYL